MYEGAITVLKHERKCVLRQSTEQGCNHKCESCDLALPDRAIIAGYDLAIKALEDKDGAEKYRRAKEVIEVRYPVFQCPTCKSLVWEFQSFCHDCGQKLSWEAMENGST